MWLCTLRGGLLSAVWLAGRCGSGTCCRWCMSPNACVRQSEACMAICSHRLVWSRLCLHALRVVPTQWLLVRKQPARSTCYNFDDGMTCVGFVVAAPHSAHKALVLICSTVLAVLTVVWAMQASGIRGISPHYYHANLDSCVSAWQASRLVKVANMCGLHEWVLPHKHQV